MFLVNTNITVNWVTPATVAPIPYSDFNISVKTPEGIITYIESAIAEEDYLLPTETTIGAVAYTFMPDEVGVWSITLSTGEESSHEIEYEYFLRVSQNDTHVYQQVKG